MAELKRRKSKTPDKPEKIEGTDGPDGALYLKRPTLRFAENVVKAKGVDPEAMPVMDTVLWAFQEGVVCDENGEAFTNIKTLDDVEAHVETSEALSIFAAVMAKLGGQLNPKAQRGRGTRKR